MPFQIPSDAVARFDEDGYVLSKKLFSPEEVGLILDAVRSDSSVGNHASDRLDSEGSVTRLSLRNDLGGDVLSTIVRCRRVAETMEHLLGHEIYHYHHKLMLKEPRVGGAWEWHQDYGYWYNFGCLFPDMASCFIALDPADRANGCLQVIRGSHKMGRIDHGKVGGQTGADIERVTAALERMEHVYVEMDPGDSLFFHGNLLHRSDRNTSDRSRWSLVCCYNTRHNSPYKDSRHPAYAPLQKCDDDEVARVAREQISGRIAC